MAQTPLNRTFTPFLRRACPPTCTKDPSLHAAPPTQRGIGGQTHLEPRPPPAASRTSCEHAHHRQEHKRSRACLLAAGILCPCCTGVRPIVGPLMMMMVSLWHMRAWHEHPRAPTCARTHTLCAVTPSLSLSSRLNLPACYKRLQSSADTFLSNARPLPGEGCLGIPCAIRVPYTLRVCAYAYTHRHITNRLGHDAIYDINRRRQRQWRSCGDVERCVNVCACVRVCVCMRA